MSEHICEGTNDYDEACVRGRVIVGIDPYGDTQSWDAGPCECPCHAGTQQQAGMAAVKAGEESTR